MNRIVLVQMSYYGNDNSYSPLTPPPQEPRTFRGIAVINPAAPDSDATISRLVAAGVRGIPDQYYRATSMGLRCGYCEAVSAGRQAQYGHLPAFESAVAIQVLTGFAGGSRIHPSS